MGTIIFYGVFVGLGLCIAMMVANRLDAWFGCDPDDFMKRPKSLDEQLADERAARAHQEALARIRR